MSEIPNQGDIPEFHRLTGEAVRSWASVEDSLWHFVGVLLGVDQFRARIVMASMVGSRIRREFISRLAETYLDPSLLPQFRSLIQRMKSLGQWRNALAHAPMHINVDGRQNMVISDVFSHKMDGGLDFEAKVYPLNDLKVLVKSLNGLRHDLLMFLLQCDGRVFHDPRVNRERVSDTDTGATA
jgi:hypothetical protein